MDVADARAVMRSLLARAVAAGASDVHLSTGEPPLLRVDGVMCRLTVGPRLVRGSLQSHAGGGLLDDVPDLLRALLVLMNGPQQHLFSSGADVDFGLDLELDQADAPCTSLRLRVNAYRQRRGPAAAIRLVPQAVPSLDELGGPHVSSVLGAWALLARGLVLCTGATGMGKSSTLAAMVDHRNAHSAGHILTIEDPIEFIHASRRCLVTQREVGAHTGGFAPALRSALREDPDVILVGELRDLETIRLALTAAETGHLVLATLHASSAAQAAGRLIDVFPPEEQATVRTMLAESLQGVVTQVLCRRAAGGGRVAAFELLRATAAVRHLIREDKPAQLVSVMQSGLAQGMQTLDQHLRARLSQGLISADEARLHARQPENFT